jgi:hypothetical protein
MTKDTQLRLHNFTPTAVLNYGSEKWIVKQRGTQTGSSTKGIFKRISRTDKIRNTETGEGLNVKIKFTKLKNTEVTV